jgi:hypothetical protein
LLRADWRQASSELSACRTEIDRVRVTLGYGRRWTAFSNLSEEDRRLLCNCEGVAAWNAQQQRVVSAGDRARPSGFSVNAWLAGITARGGSVAVAGDTILIAPKGVANETDKSVIKEHRREIVAALSEGDEF